MEVPPRSGPLRLTAPASPPLPAPTRRFYTRHPLHTLRRLWFGWISERWQQVDPVALGDASEAQCEALALLTLPTPMSTPMCTPLSTTGEALRRAPLAVRAPLESGGAGVSS